MQQQTGTAPSRHLLHHSRSLCAGDVRSAAVQPPAQYALGMRTKLTRSSSLPELTTSGCVLHDEPVASAGTGILSSKTASESEEPAAAGPTVAGPTAAEPTVVGIPAHMLDFDVFLAGSCNPTTWRQELAIPLLDRARVKYYNPQVDDWYEELIAIETHVMETAKVLLIVIDSITRTLVSINEAIEYICRGRRVVLVVDDIAPGTRIEGATVTQEELVDLNDARACLRNLAAKKRTRLYGNVQDAVRGTIQWLQEDSESSFVCDEPPRLWRRVSRVLNTWWSGRKTNKPRRNTTPRSVSEPEYSVPTSQASTGSTVQQQHGCQSHGNHVGRRSIYLRGNGAKSTAVAVSLLQEAGVPFEHSHQHMSSKAPSSSSSILPRGRGRRNPAQAEKDSGTELTLLVIPSHIPSIAAMTDAVELIASRQCAVLLVIEPFEEGCVVSKDGRVVSGREFKDLARARAYLQATAQRNGVQAFTSVVDAVKSLGERC